MAVVLTCILISRYNNRGFEGPLSLDLKIFNADPVCSM